MKHDEIVELAGVKFRVNEVRPGYRQLIPVEDELWLLRHIDPRKHPEK